MIPARPQALDQSAFRAKPRFHYGMLTLVLVAIATPSYHDSEKMPADRDGVQQCRRGAGTAGPGQTSTLKLELRVEPINRGPCGIATPSASNHATGLVTRLRVGASWAMHRDSNLYLVNLVT